MISSVVLAALLFAASASADMVSIPIRRQKLTKPLLHSKLGMLMRERGDVRPYTVFASCHSRVSSFCRPFSLVVAHVCGAFPRAGVLPRQCVHRHPAAVF